MLYKSSKIINIGEVIKLPIIVREDLLLKASTKQQLRGNTLEGT